MARRKKKGPQGPPPPPWSTTAAMLGTKSGSYRRRSEAPPEYKRAPRRGRPVPPGQQGFQFDESPVRRLGPGPQVRGLLMPGPMVEPAFSPHDRGPIDPDQEFSYAGRTADPSSSSPWYDVYGPVMPPGWVVGPRSGRSRPPTGYHVDPLTGMLVRNRRRKSGASTKTRNAAIKKRVRKLLAAASRDARRLKKKRT